MDSETFLHSRMSWRSIVSGILSCVGIMALLMTLAAGFGLWRFDLVETPNLGGGFWIWTAVSWIIALFVSGNIAAVSSRSITVRDGALHGFVTWGASCTAILLMVGPTLIRIFDGALLGDARRSIFWLLFFGNVLSLGASVRGGVMGSRDEARSEKEERSVSPGMARPAYQS